MEQRSTDLYRALARAIWLAAGITLAFWFLAKILLVVLLFILAFILVLALNPPVTWLEQKKVPRAVAAVLVSLAAALVLALIGWLIVPHLIDQISRLSRNLPSYLTSLEDRLSRLFVHYPDIQQRLHVSMPTLLKQLPAMPTLLMRVGWFTLSFFEVLAFAIVVASVVVYTLAQPRPLLHSYLLLMPLPVRDRAERAFARGSQMVVGWIYAHLIVGTIEAIAAGIFLTLMGIPGALVWAGFTFFAELVPRIGPYMMAVPPLLEALAIRPILALWVALFYTALNETMGTFVLPFLWGKEMALHPVSLLFAVLALASAFGLLGALLAVPVTGFVKACFEEFYLAAQPKDTHAPERMEHMLNREMETTKTPP